MKRTARSPSAVSLPAKIFKIMVRDDANELGLVVAYPTPESDDNVIVKGEVKKFSTETEKLKFLHGIQTKGFTNFENCTGRFDIETVVLEELVRRQAERDRILQERQKNGLLATSTRTVA